MSTGDEQPKRWRTDIASLIWFMTVAAVLAALLGLFRDSPGSLFWFPLVIAPSALIVAILLETRGRAWPGIIVGTALGSLLGYAMSRLSVSGKDLNAVEFRLVMCGLAGFGGGWAGGGLHALRLGHRRIGLVAMSTSLGLLAAIILFVVASRPAN